MYNGLRRQLPVMDLSQRGDIETLSAKASRNREHPEGLFKPCDDQAIQAFGELYS